MVIFLSACVERILRLFTNFYLQRKFSIFLRNNHDCMVVDPYNARKRYAVIESLDLIRNIPWLANCFCKIKKSNWNQKTDTTAQLYCTISTYVTPLFPTRTKKLTQCHNCIVRYSKYIRIM
jgi:hypothetical protein